MLGAFPRVVKPIELAKNRLLQRTTIEVYGSRFRPLDSESVFVLSPEFEGWMWKHLRFMEGNVFIDIGAHIGKYTVQIAKVVGEGGLVVAVEPHPENYKALVENIRLNGLRNVISVNAAAWCGEDNLRLFIGDKCGHHSLVRSFGRGFIKVRARALDGILRELKVEKADWVKIDVEGAEFEVLKGSLNTLRKHRPTVIIEITKNQSEIEELVSELGYGIENIAPTYYLLKPR